MGTGLHGFARVLWLAAVAACTLGCEPDTVPLDWEFVFESPADGERAVAVVGVVRAGGCDGEEVYRAEATRDRMPDPGPLLEPGRYGFAGRARDASCVELAAGCAEVTLPSSEGTVVVTLAPIDGQPLCEATACRDGDCVSPDADVIGADGGPRDAGVDAGGCPAEGCGECQTCDGDECVPLPEESTCAGGLCHGGVCCAGCWDGTECRAGDDAAACGTGGGTCAACECASDICSAGTCEIGRRAVSLATGAASSYVVTDDGRLYAWGANDAGQLGVGTMGVGTESLAPVQIGTADDWASVGAGELHVCAIRGDGALYCWGNNDDGQLGVDDLMARSSPVRVGMGLDWSRVVGGVLGDMTCALDTASALSCFGQNNYGQLGVGGFADGTTPATVAGAWSEVTLGHHHGCGLQADGTLHCWGRNQDGQLGLGDTMDRSLPTQVGTASDWAAVAAGENHSCAIRAGMLFCWGRGTSGVLGTGSTGDQLVPERVGMGSDWATVDGGPQHTCALRADASLWCWGGNGDGQLAIGVVSGDVLEPMRALGEDYVDVHLGSSHTCALRGSGVVVCAGENTLGQLGQGDRANRLEPTRVCF